MQIVCVCVGGGGGGVLYQAFATLEDPKIHKEEGNIP